VNPPSPVTTRRSTSEVQRAIHAAVLAELVQVGYTDLALERVAKRAGVGRASLYRYWSSKRDLVADAIADALPPLERAPATGNVRSDLIICFQKMHGHLDGLGTLAIQSVTAELHRPGVNPLVTLVRDRVLEPRLQVILDVLLAGVARGEVRPEAAVPILARTGPALLLQHLLMYGTPAPASTIEDIVDRVILPSCRTAH
jgi:AcrR family transcriptional regulator